MSDQQTIYRVTTPTPGYTGPVAGVQFDRGVYVGPLTAFQEGYFARGSYTLEVGRTPDDLDGMVKARLVELAAAEGIDLAGARTNQQIVARIREHRAGVG